MKFENVELLPAVVIDASDPLQLGRVKINAPTLFPADAETEALPWVSPLNMGGYQHHSTLTSGSKIWVFKTKDNYEEFWYITMNEYTSTTKSYISDYKNAEVVFARDAGTNTVALFYNDSEGIKLLMGDTALININSNGEIICKSNNGYVQIKDNCVYCGSDGPANHVMMGEPLQQALEKFAANLSEVAAVWQASYGGSISGAAPTKLKSYAENFKSSVANDLIVCKNTLAD